MQEEYDRYASMDDEVASMRQEHKRLLGAYRSAAKDLTTARMELAVQFEKNMMSHLSDLGMSKTVFSVQFADKVDGKQTMPQADGDDVVEFMISPNPGEPLKPLAKIASGG